MTDTKGAGPGADGKALLEQVLETLNVTTSDAAAPAYMKALGEFVGQMAREGGAVVKVDRQALDAMIRSIDERLEAQVNEILHHPKVQKLESAWRSLRFVVDRINFTQNIRLDLLDVDRDTLQAEAEEYPADVTGSGLYKIAYSSAYGIHGGKPYGVMNLDLALGPLARDVGLMQYVARVASIAHIPTFANAAPDMFRKKGFERMEGMSDLKALFDKGPEYAAWKSFRASEEARYLGLCMPRFLLRLPYDAKEKPVESFSFNEDVTGKHQNYLWGMASNTMITRVADSFAKYGWAPNIIGPQSGGTVGDLPLHHYPAMGEIQTKIPTETEIPDPLELELSEEGFIPLVYRKESNNACFMSANSVQAPKKFEGSPTADANHRLGTQLPYMFIITRLAHYIKMLQREQIGSWKERSTLERELNTWIGQYVSDMDDPAPAVRARRPLREAQVTVEDVEGQPGWYQCGIRVRPAFKYMGAAFTLSLVGKLDKK